METCYLCGETARPLSATGPHKVCPMCDVGFCPSCAGLVGTCQLCGAPLGIRTATTDGASPAVYSPVVYIERRGRMRRTYRALTEFALATTSGRVRWRYPIRAITRNISPRGLCIFTMMPLRKGQKIAMREGELPGHRGLGTVRWVRRVNDRTYTAGIEFEDPAGTETAEEKLSCAGNELPSPN